MCTTTVAQRILDALQARISNESVFSVFDITTDARDGTDEQIRHKDVKRIVTNEFKTGQFPDDYDKEVIQLDMMDKPNVIVYYPDGKSASDHPKALKQSTIPTNIPVNSIPLKSSMGGNTKDGKEYICKVTAEGRVNIPKNILTQVSCSNGTYDILFNGKEIFYKTLNTDGRLRIAKSDLGDGDTFKVGVDIAMNVITIE